MSPKHTLWLTYIQFLAVAWCNTIISNGTATLSNRIISCNNNERCSVQCVSYRSCFGTSIHCNHSTQCHIDCMDTESCFGASIYQSSQNEEIVINCHSTRSCVYLSVYGEPNNHSIDNTSASSFTLYAVGESSAKGMTIDDITSHSHYYIYCNATRSCDALRMSFNPLYHNQSISSIYPSFQMYIQCLSTEACNDITIQTENEWDDYIRDYGIIYKDFNIDILCFEALSCYDAKFDFANLLVNSVNDTDYANITIHCVNQETCCDGITVVCPDLYPFNAEYDYIYHQDDIRCHIEMQSYSKGIVMESKHGYNMVDIQCNGNYTAICDEVRVFCTEVHIGCTMKYNYSVSMWYCDNLGELYMFHSQIAYADDEETRFHKYYGCNNFTWFSDTTVVKISEIPQYDTNTHQHIDCLSYNPQATSQCIIQCDTTDACHSAYLYCNQVDECIVECNGDTVCKGYPFIYCPYDNTVSSVYIKNNNDEIDYTFLNTERFCAITISPLLQDISASRGSITVHAVHNNSVVVVSDSTTDWMVYDRGIRSMTLNIGENVVSNTNISYFKERWFRFYNFDWWGNTEDIDFSINCEFCYMGWLLLEGYQLRSSVASIHCANCEYLAIDIYGVSSSFLYCDQNESNCNHLHLSLTDYNLSIACGPSCNDLILDNAPYLPPEESTYLSWVNLGFFANQTQYIHINSLYGFDFVDIYYDPSLVILPSIAGYCGYPDFFIDCGSNPNKNTCGLDECMQHNPQYHEDSLFVVLPASYMFKDVTFNVVFCKGFFSCARANISCGKQCIINCIGIYSCYLNHIYTLGYDVIVNCVGHKSCRGITLVGDKDTENIEINCKGLESCTNMAIDHSAAMSMHSGIGLNVTCYNPSELVDVLPNEGDACYNMDISCPSIPTSTQLIGKYIDSDQNSDVLQAKCHLDFQGNIVQQSQSINIYHQFNGVPFLDLQCSYHSCKYVTYYCVNKTMKSEWEYDSSSNSIICIGECCDYINSEAPSNAPTAAPSRAPTIWSFGDTDYFEALFRVKFHFKTSTDFDLFLAKNIQLMDAPYIWIQSELETSYLIADAMDAIDSFSMFSVDVTSIIMEQAYDYEVSYLINTKIWCEEAYINDILGITQHDDDFQQHVESALNHTYETYASYVEFEIISAMEIEGPDFNELPLNQGTILSLVVTFTVFVIAFVGWLHSKNKVCFTKTRDCDDTQWLSIVTYGLQIFDLYTDIAFLFELITKYQFMLIAGEKQHIVLLKTLWISSCIFIIIPYVSNIINVIRLQRNWDMGDAYVQTWFADNNKKFAAFVLLSGSVFAALKLISSKLFGLSIFSAPVSKYKVNAMDNYKIYYNVLLENLPQLLIQLLYIAYFEGSGISVTVIASTTSSIFSILLSVVAFCMKRGNQSTYKNADALARFYIDIIYKMNVNDDTNKSREELPLKGTAKSGSRMDGEVKKLYKIQGRRKKLATKLAKVFGFHKKSIEFVYSVEKQKGIELYGICTSLQQSELSKTFNKSQKELESTVLSTYNLSENEWQFALRFPDGASASKHLMRKCEEKEENVKGTVEMTDENKVNMSLALHKATQEETKHVQYASSEQEDVHYQE